MSIFNLKRKLMFEAEETPLEPYQVRLRFRRRVALLSFLLMFILVSIPIVREQGPTIDSNLAARQLAIELIRTRSESIKNRAPTSIVLNKENNIWERFFFPEGADNCSKTPLNVPIEKFERAGITW